MALRERTLGDGTKRWDVRFRPAGSRRLVTETYQSRDAAMMRDLQLRQANAGDRASVPANSNVTVGSAYESWIEARRRSVRRRQLKPKVLANDEDQWRIRVSQEFGHLPLRRVTVDHVQRWVDHMDQSGLAASTIRSTLKPLKLVFDHALRSGVYAGLNPATLVEVPPLPERDHVYLSKPEVLRLAELLGSQGDVAILLAFLGLRFGELVGLRVRDVDLGRGRVNVRRSITNVRGRRSVGTPKSKAGVRSVPIPLVARTILERRIDGKLPDDVAVAAPRGGLLSRENWVRDTGWSKAKVEIGRPDLTIHSLRHTYASLARSAGADLRLLQKTMGHANVVVTSQIYADLFDEELDRVAEALDNL